MHTDALRFLLLKPPRSSVEAHIAMCRAGLPSTSQHGGITTCVPSKHAHARETPPPWRVVARTVPVRPTVSTEI